MCYAQKKHTGIESALSTMSKHNLLEGGNNMQEPTQMSREWLTIRGKKISASELS
jgi:hypothetical protein